MNDTFLKKSLIDTPETVVKVSASLHQDIMRAVRLAEPAVGKPWINRGVPTLGAAVLAMFVAGVLFYLPATAPVMHSPAPVPAQLQSLHSSGSLMVLRDGLLGVLKDTPPPEEELRKELEHLKSDLQRFDFRS